MRMPGGDAMVKLNRSSKPLKGRIIRVVATALIPAWYLVIAQVACLADEESRKQEILSAFEKRMEHARNLHFVCESQTMIHADNHGELGPITGEAPVVRFEYWQLNDSNRQDSQRVNSEGEEYVDAATFDAEKGKGMSYWINGNRSSSGSIDATRAGMMSTNRYRFWLNIRDWGLGQSEYLFNYVLDRRASLEVLQQEGKLIQITTDYAPRWSGGKSGGERRLWLDVEKGFLPVRGEFKWRDNRMGRTESFEVIESKNVAGVWMPTVLREHIIGSGARRPPIHNVVTMRVTEMKQGEVTASDLKIDFPRNTEFVDSRHGVRFVGDENGNPIGSVESLLVPKQKPPPPSTASVIRGKALEIARGNVVPIAMAILLILATFAYFSYRRFTARKLSTRARST